MSEPTEHDRKTAAELIYGNRPRDQVESVARALAEERLRIVLQLRDFADDLHGVTGARWIADGLTSTLDRISEQNAP